MQLFYRPSATGFSHKPSLRAVLGICDCACFCPKGNGRARFRGVGCNKYPSLRPLSRPLPSPPSLLPHLHHSASSPAYNPRPSTIGRSKHPSGRPAHKPEQGITLGTGARHDREQCVSGSATPISRTARARPTCAASPTRLAGPSALPVGAVKGTLAFLRHRDTS